MLFDFDVNGDKQVSRELVRFAGWAGDASPAFRAIADQMREIEQRQFESEGDAASGGWAPLASSTVLHKQHAGLRPEILQATGALMDSLTETGRDHVEKVRPMELRFGTKIPYAQFHQSGTSKMPRRRPIEFSERNRREFMRTLQRYLVTGQTTIPGLGSLL